jgi:hypothetical protein
VRAPETAGSGVAKVRLSFDTWKKGKVEPTIVEILVNPPPKLGKKVP